MMRRLDEALSRLEQALLRLEAVLAARPDEAAMTGQLAMAEAENARLRAAAGDIASRVDGALARLGEALGERG